MTEIIAYEMQLNKSITDAPDISGKEITNRHVADWNQGAIMLYEKCGFEIVKAEKVR